jgi:hypothetical protein
MAALAGSRSTRTKRRFPTWTRHAAVIWQSTASTTAPVDLDAPPLDQPPRLAPGLDAADLGQHVDDRRRPGQHELGDVLGQLPLLVNDLEMPLRPLGGVRAVVHRDDLPGESAFFSTIGCSSPSRTSRARASMSSTLQRVTYFIHSSIVSSEMLITCRTARWPAR